MSCTYIRCSAEKQMGREGRGTLIQSELPACGDALLSRYGGSMQMVYLDPPFNTGKRFDMKMRVGAKGYRTGSPTLALPAYEDRWRDRAQYLGLMREALVVARGLLKKRVQSFCTRTAAWPHTCAC